MIWIHSLLYQSICLDFVVFQPNRNKKRKTKLINSIVVIILFGMQTWVVSRLGWLSDLKTFILLDLLLILLNIQIWESMETHWVIFCIQFLDKRLDQKSRWVGSDWDKNAFLRSDFWSFHPNKNTIDESVEFRQILGLKNNIIQLFCVFYYIFERVFEKTHNLKNNKKRPYLECT